ncbi:MAG: CHAD domain-containing protein [Vicinamibacterales bacterium]
MSAFSPEALLARQIEALEAQLSEAVQGSVKGIHQARVASRRLREVLPIVGPPAGKRHLQEAERRIRDLTRLLGPVRELDVSLELLAELKVTPAAAAAFPPLRALVAAERQHRRRRLTATLDGKLARATLRSVRAVLERIATTSDSSWRDRATERARTRAATFITTMYAVGALFDSARLHAVRIAAKKLRYAVELVDDAGLFHTGKALDVLKRTQEQLGRLHDLQVVLVFARAPELAAGPRRNELAALREQLERECHVEHGRYLRRRKRLLAVADRIIDGLAPQPPHRIPSRSARS